jgi:pimeloyl-ACP methyl ester carboxylesterase
MTEGARAEPGALPPLPLPAGIRTRRVRQANGLEMHVLEAGRPEDPCVVLLHGFPELAYSWRDVMPSLAAAGYYVVAPDQRGFGRTTGWDDRYDGDLTSFRQMNLVTDLLALLTAMDIPRATALVGHDFGSVVAAWAALIRPDVFEAVVLMSAPFAGPPGPALREGPAFDLDRALAGLNPPRRHYTHFFATPGANADMRDAPQGLSAFLRAYFHAKSGDFAANAPYALGTPTPEAFSKLPPYYVMPREKGMAETVAAMAPSPAEVAACRWLTAEDLGVYASEFARTGFQGGLNWYRMAADPALRLFAGRTIDVPATFIGGARDWGVYQSPGAFEAMATRACSRFIGATLVPGAGHWVQQEAPEATSSAILAFLDGAAKSPG